MNEFRREELAADLKTAQMEVTPEMYTANAIVKALLIGVLAVPVYFIFPILTPVVLFLAFVLYRMNIKAVRVRIGSKRSKIEADCPVWSQRLKRSWSTAMTFWRRFRTFPSTQTRK